ncbi:hypothetical protein BHE74_00031063 [Ensete ventricosum]|nr:hypothetical protein GW17_00033591 [Ensete ventricosum]RWW61855.1 hypothetical protein BHE74_00031063 [Ensete ventricosum]RZS10044.1 hypothetical protein BHM03_00041195 [Ensete ventricosum]
MITSHSLHSFAEPSDLTSLGRSVSFCFPIDQVGMVSTPSFSISSFSSPLSSLVPPREERCRSNDSLGNQLVPESLSSGVMTRADAKALQALEAMKSHHNFDSTICLESLGSVRKRFSIPSEYKKDRRKSLHKANRATRGKGPADTSAEPPAPRQRPKSVRELCSARVRVDGRDYHAIRMCNLPEQAFDAPLDPDLRPLMHGTSVWQSGEASATYPRRVAPTAGVRPVHSFV